MQLQDRRPAEEPAPRRGERERASRLHVLVRTLDQLRAALDWHSADANLRSSTVYCDFEDVRKYKDAVPLARAAGIPVGLATVRVIKPDEEGLRKLVADCEPARRIR